MRLKIFFWIVLLWTASLSEARAEVTGDELVHWCMDKLPSRQSLCIGYVRGIIDGLALWGPGICLGDDPDLTPRLREAKVVQYLVAHPSSVNRTKGAFAVIDAFRASVSCQGQP
jgi:hypothetical protein